MLSMPRIVRPDPFGIGFPAGPALAKTIKRNKELPERSDGETATSNRSTSDAILRSTTAERTPTPECEHDEETDHVGQWNRPAVPDPLSDRARLRIHAG